MKKRTDSKTIAATLLLSSVLSLPAFGQATASPPTEAEASADSEEIITLSPFEVRPEETSGYAATTTMAGTRIRTQLADVGSAISVVTSEFLRDTGAMNNETLLQYTTNTEVGNIYGNFAGVGNSAALDESSKFTSPNNNTRVRGLDSADNTRDYFLTDLPWDGYNVDRVDMQRGPNAILFGLGSPAGIINTTTRTAVFKDSGEVEFRFSRFGSTRATIDINKELIDDELAVRVSAVRDHEKFQQDPAFEDDDRIFGALRWEPKFLARGSAHTTFRANFENGNINSNRPRSLPPVDGITPWFMTGTYDAIDAAGTEVEYSHMNRQGYDPYYLQDNVTGLPNRGQDRPTLDSGGPNPYFQPWIGPPGQTYGGPDLMFGDENSDEQSYYYASEWKTLQGGLNSLGNRDGGLGLPYQKLAAPQTYSQYAKDAHLPLADYGVYKNFLLTDPSIFDFYNNLIDGDNKKEWQDFTAYNFTLNQTFLNQKIGIEVAYDHQEYSNGKLSFLADQRAAIYVDINQYMAYNPLNPGVADLNDQSTRINPNFGRPFVTDATMYGNNSYDSERDATRVTGFGELDFADFMSKDSWLTRLLGRHDFTGLYSKDIQETENRGWVRWATDQAYNERIGGSFKITDNERLIAPVSYLGPSVANRTSASGANIPRLNAMRAPADGTMTIFNSTWNSDVEPGAEWINEFYPVGHGSRIGYQADNPANYVGYQDISLHVLDSENGYRDALTYSARLNKQEISSKAFVWQGYLWDGALVGTYGWRDDVAKSWQYRAGLNLDGGANLGEAYKLADAHDVRIQDESESWSVVGHLSKISRTLGEKMPVNVSFFYNESENFRPAAGRVDVYARPLSPPTGRTEDTGILISTKNDRYSFKINKYKTNVINASSSALNGWWFIGGLEEWGGEWANIFQYNLGDMAIGSQNQGNSGRYNYGQAPGETADMAAARETAAVQAWRAHQARINPIFYDAWALTGINHPENTANIKSYNRQDVPGFTPTEDATSEGYEYEFTAQPLDNWRITFNAAKTTAYRRNVGGEALIEVVNIINTDLNTTPAGDLRIWWGSPGSTTTLKEWNGTFYSNYRQIALGEGTAVPELRKWHFNLVSNYDFKSGFMKGVNVGVGYRWEDDVIIGYPPIEGELAGTIAYDFANPYRGPSEDYIDLWFGYNRRLSEKIDWRIQLNIRNAFEDDGLIPISTQPDGTVAAYRIAPVQVWTLTNTFKF